MANEFIFDIPELDDYLLNYVDILCDNIILININYQREIYNSNILKQLLALREINGREIINIPKKACLSEYLELAEHILRVEHFNFPEQFPNLLNTLFTKCIIANSIKIVDFLVKLADEFNIKFDIHSNFENLFRSSCKEGHLGMAKWLYEYGNNINSIIDINARRYDAFLHACYNGHLDVMKWLVSIGNETDNAINIDFQEACMFIYCCKEGRLEIAKWLFEHRNEINYILNINDIEKYAFRHAYFNRHLDVMKWLVSIGDEIGSPIDNALSDEAFINCCGIGFLEGAQWLIEITENRNISIDIHANNDKAVISACANGHYELVEWFLELCLYIDSPIRNITQLLIQASSFKNKMEMLINVINYVKISNLTY